MFNQSGYQPQPVTQNAFGFQQPGAFDIAGQMSNNYANANSGFGNWQNPALTQPYAAPQIQPQVQAETGFGLNTNTFGALGSIAQGAGALMQGYTGFKQLGIAKDQLAFQKDVFAKNWANQVATTNSQLRDRQNARRGASSSYQDTDGYLQQNQVK